MAKISVIIPVYNVAPWLCRCLDSVCRQTLSNLEILLIDDGSTDGSGQICDEYAGKDKRICVFHQNNQRVSAARNVGIRNFTGEYLGFVDPDDWIEPDMYQMLYSQMRDFDTDISITNYFKDQENQGIALDCAHVLANQRLSQRDMLLFVFRAHFYVGFSAVLLLAM